MSDLIKLDPRRLAPRNLTALKRQPASSLLGLALDGSRLEGVVVRRTNGSVEVKKSFGVTLSLEPLTNAPELVGREIRKHLEAAGIRERRCAVCVPLSWALTLTVKLPDLPEEDLVSFLQIEAERSFPYSPDALVVEHSRFRTPGGEHYATLVAVPREHLTRLEAVLREAQLKAVSFSLGITTLQRPDAEPSRAVLAMSIGESNVGLQVSCGGGLAVLRTIEGAFEMEGGGRQFQVDPVAREFRITLGQLPADVRETVRNLRLFGHGETAEEIVEQLAARVKPLGIQIEQVKSYAPDEFGVRLPADTAVTPALSLAVRCLAGRGAGLEFLPPKISAWKQFAARHSSRRFFLAGAAAAAVALLIGLAFGVQQWQLIRWRSKWAGMKMQVNDLEFVQTQIKRYRPWFDESFRSLSILRRLTEAFPEDGAVTAKTVEIREPSLVTCSGTARDQQALLRTLDKLRAASQVSSVQVEQMRGRSPMQFSFNFHWGERGGQ